MSLVVPPSTISGVLEYYWIDPAGVLRNLNRAASPSLYAIAGSLGLGDVEYDISSDKRPFSSGNVIRQIGTLARKIELPIYVNAPSLGQLVVLVEDMHDWFATGDETLRRPGYFRVIRPDGTIRKIACYYQSGLQGDMKTGAPWWTTYVASLFCPDPNPTGDATITQVWSVPGGVPAILDISIINPGRLDAYPVWTIDGPFANNINLLNQTTGKNLGFTPVTLTVGQWMKIDTRPADIRDGLAVYNQSSTNLMNTIGIGSPPSVFWPLVAGQNNVRISFQSGTSGSTRVTLDYLPRYRSLLR